MSWLSPTGAGAAGNMLQTSAIGSTGGLSSGDLAAALKSNPLLSSLDPSQVTGASAPSQPGLMSKLGSGLSGIAGAALAPETGGASMLLPMVTGLLGGGGSSSPPPPAPQLQHSQGQPVNPIIAQPVGGLSGPLGSGSGLNPQLMKLIQMLSGGGGGIS